MIDKMLNGFVLLWALLAAASMVAFGVWDFTWWAPIEDGKDLPRALILLVLHILPLAVLAHVE